MSDQLHPPRPVKLIVGILCRDGELIDLSFSQMESLWGQTDIRSERTAFTQTSYYEKQMGSDLLRQFASFDTLIGPGELARIKHQSNALELELARSETGKAVGVDRPVNLDPGYVDPSKLVLASTKNYSHRIYIGLDMYAEPTLHWHKGQWQSWPFTYPDYAGGAYFEFLSQARNRLMEQLSSQN